MSGSQASSAFRTPPRWLVPWITKLNVLIYEKSDGRYGARGGGMPFVLLRVQGRKSGRSQTVCLPYWMDNEGRRVVVASFGGGPRNPAWYHNLADRDINPRVWVKDRAEEFWAEAEVLDGDDHTETWAQLTADRPFYHDYQARTDRRIPIVRLSPVSGR